MKRVLLFVVDGCTSRVMRPAVERGDLPALAALIERGRIDYDCVSVFPSITPAATASIVTGRYPREHGIAGMSWWNPEASKVSYFGDDVWTVLRRGIATFLRDFLLQLNGGRLRAPTLFQTAERAGLQAGCINHLIFKGDVSHSVDPPTLLRLLPSVPSDLEVRGPSRLCLGDFVCGGFGEGRTPSGGPFSRFGFGDQGTEDVLLSVPDAGALPDFTVAYFADYDFDSHDEGPEEALETLRRVDGRLTRVFKAWGGLDRVLSEACIMLTADHSHCEIAREDPGIDLSEVLRDWTLADPAAGWQDDEDLMVCPNMRAAEVYFHRPAAALIDAVSAALLAHPHVDHVITRNPDDPSGEFGVATRDRGTLRFSAAGSGDAHARDPRGGRWRFEGELEAIDARVTAGGEIRYGVYPNALERVAGSAEESGVARLWVTAGPGYEFQLTGQSPHARGGSHGTLHELDSLVPLLMTAAPDGVDLPSRPRIVDVEPLCRQVLGLASPVRPGASHARRVLER